MADPRITLEEVLHVAGLARLELNADEAEKMQSELDAILDYIAELEELDLRGVEPTFHSIPIDAPLRPDVPARCSDRSEILEEAPASDAGGFSVPIVVEVDG